MKKIIFFICMTLVLTASFNAQTTQTSASKSTTQTEKARKPIFRPTKEQITQVQRMLKVAETGKMDDAFREEIKKFQSNNGLKSTGTLNRATLEKMGVELNEKQKEIPVDPKSFASPDDDKKATKRGPVFRATKEQITAAQQVLKDKKFLAGDATGTLDAPTRAALKAFQEANGMKATGTLNQATLEKMRIELTEKQKENVAKVTP